MSDKLREKVEKIVAHQFDLVTKLSQEGYEDSLKMIANQIEHLIEEAKTQERAKMTLIIYNLNSINYPYGADFKEALLQAIKEEQ